MQLIYMLLGGLASMVPTLVGRVLLSLGIGFVAYSGIDAFMAAAQAELLQRMGGLPVVALQLVGVLQVGTAVNIMASAVTAKLAIMGLQSGAVTRMIQK